MKTAQIWIFGFILTGIINAQITNETLQWSEFTKNACYNLKTRTGTTHEGLVVYENQNSIVLYNKTLFDSLIIPKSEIISYNPCASNSKANNNPLQSEEPISSHSAHLLLSRSARPEKTGSTYYSSQYLVLDNIGFTPSPNFSADMDCFLFVPYGITFTGHYKIDSEKYLSGGISVYGNMFQSILNNGVSLFHVSVQSKFTLGPTKNHLTLGLYAGGINLSVFDSSYQNPKLFWFPYGYLGYYKELSSLFSITGEAWYIPVLQAGIAGAGIRYHSGKYKDWTFGCIGAMEVLNTSQLKFDNGFFIPYLSYKYILN